MDRVELVFPTQNGVEERSESREGRWDEGSSGRRLPRRRALLLQLRVRGLDVVGGAGLGGPARGQRHAHVVGLASLGVANPHIHRVLFVAR